MKKPFKKLLTGTIGLLIVSIVGFPSYLTGQHRKLTIVQPFHNQVVKSPVTICMEVEGLGLEPAKRGVREGYGHHHILFSSLPADLSQPIGKNEAIHVSDGSKCKEVDLIPGQHIIQSLFAYGDHTPYNPLVHDKVLITVE